MSACEQATSESPRFCILGPLEARSLAGRRPVTVSQPLHRAVLATLLLRAGQPSPRAWLAKALWGTQGPADPASTLRTCVYGLRRSLGKDLGSRLRTYPGGFLIAAAEEEVDLNAYLALDARGRLAWDRGEPAAAAELLGAALRLWREPALSDLPSTPPTTSRRSGGSTGCGTSPMPRRS